MLERVDFLNRQGVHVGAQADRFVAGTALQHADDTRLASPMHRDSPSLETVGDEFGGPDFFVSQFGMSMNRSSDSFDFVVRCFDFSDQIHLNCSLV